MPATPPQEKGKTELRESRRHRFRRDPDRLVETWRLIDGTLLTWRPVSHQDHVLLGRFLGGLSRQTRFDRFLGAVNMATPTLLAQLTQMDPLHHQAFVVTHVAGEHETMVADARFIVDADPDSADFAIVVDDAWQAHGVGTHLLHLLSEAAARRGLRWLRGDVRNDNERMLRLMKRWGFCRAPHPDDDDMMQCIKLLLPPYPLSAFVDTSFVADLPDISP